MSSSTGRRLRGLLLVVGALLACASSSKAEEYYFCMIFGSQSHPKLLRYTHTWATFIRVVGEGPDLNTYQITSHTLSWYPASMKVRVLAAKPEQGVNLTLEQTLAAVYANKESVTMWGAFVIPVTLYNRSVHVYQILASGSVQYRAISTTYDLLIADCIHAVAAVDPEFGRDHYPLIRIGKPASRYIARQVVMRSLRNRGINQADYDNSWLVPRLGLNRYPIEVIPASEIPNKACVLCILPP